LLSNTKQAVTMNSRYYSYKIVQHICSIKFEVNGTE
jgi:hypothetical protein